MGLQPQSSVVEQHDLIIIGSNLWSKASNLRIVTMALLRDLPNELCVMIARFLVGRRIDHFDSLATKDLQSLRLVSQMVSRVDSRHSRILS